MKIVEHIEDIVKRYTTKYLRNPQNEGTEQTLINVCREAQSLRDEEWMRLINKKINALNNKQNYSLAGKKRLCCKMEPARLKKFGRDTK